MERLPNLNWFKKDIFCILYRALLRAASHSLIQLYMFILKNIHIELSPKVSQTGGTGPHFFAELGLKWEGRMKTEDRTKKKGDNISNLT